jgi:hypothetical protein
MSMCRKECHVSSAHARPLALVIGGALALLATGCASADQPEVERVASVFEDPSAAASARCDLLLPTAREQLEQDAQSSCAKAITSLPLHGGDVAGVEVWGGDVPAAHRSALRLRGELVVKGVRMVFIAYLATILIGIAYVVLLGLAGR